MRTENPGASSKNKSGWTFYTTEQTSNGATSPHAYLQGGLQPRSLRVTSGDDKVGQRWAKAQRWKCLPVHQSQLCPHSRWAAQTCRSSWWIPINKPPGWGFGRISGCWIPSGPCCIGKGPSRRSPPDFWWLRWWSWSVSSPQCNPTNWSSGGCRRGCRPGSVWAQS